MHNVYPTQLQTNNVQPPASFSSFTTVCSGGSSTHGSISLNNHQHHCQNCSPIPGETLHHVSLKTLILHLCPTLLRTYRQRFDPNISNKSGNPHYSTSDHFCGKQSCIKISKPTLNIKQMENKTTMTSHPDKTVRCWIFSRTNSESGCYDATLWCYLWYVDQNH